MFELYLMLPRNQLLNILFVLQQRVSSLNISGNLDAPEGGFDAIMQAIVCMVCTDSIQYKNK